MTDNSLARLVFDVPVLLSRDPKEIIEQTALLGRNAGLDDDWVPRCLEEAVFEILVSAGGAPACEDRGVIFRPDLIDTDEGSSLFSLRLELLASEEDVVIERMMDFLPLGWPERIEAGCLSVLMQPAPPLDFGVEIIDHPGPEDLSSHARIARAARIEHSLRDEKHTRSCTAA